jgi:hypothetical protein
VLARLRLNGEQIFEGPPAKFPYVYEALSAKFNFPHHFEVEVEDAEGLKDTAPPRSRSNSRSRAPRSACLRTAGALASGIAGARVHPQGHLRGGLA